ncbi:hypothetical protein GCM10027564_10190 [Luteimonas notoginsengisoli]
MAVARCRECTQRESMPGAAHPPLMLPSRSCGPRADTLAWTLPVAALLWIPQGAA